MRPGSSLRQSVRYYLGQPDNPVPGSELEPEYDLVERVVRFRTETLQPGQLYTVEILRPGVDDKDYGFRAFDDAPLEDGSVPLKFHFRTKLVDPPPAVSDPDPPTCAQIQDAFTRMGCSGAACHNPGGSAACPKGFGAGDDQVPGKTFCVAVPRMGLDLKSTEGLLATAIGKVAHQAETGAKTGAPIINARVGVGMPIITANSPGNSYLLYKMLRRPDSYFESRGNPDLCTSLYPNLPFGPGNDCMLPPEAELTRLREWFVRGEPMPLRLYDNSTLGRADVRLIQSWIRAGAPVDQCQ